MKRIVCMTLAVLLVLSMAGCGNAPKTEEIEVSAKEPEMTSTAAANSVSKTESTAPKTESTAPKTESTAPKTESIAPKTETVAPKAEATVPKTENSSQNRADWEKAIDEGIAETMAKIEAEKGINYEYCYRQCELINQIRRRNGLHAVSYDITKQYLADWIAKDYWNQKNNLPVPGTAYMNSIWIDADDCIHNIVRKSGEERYLDPTYTSMVAGHYADSNGSYWVQLFFTDDSIQPEERELVDGLTVLSDGLSALNDLFELLQ